MSLAPSRKRISEREDITDSGKYGGTVMREELEEAHRKYVK